MAHKRLCLISCLIKYMQKFQRADWLRARQLIPNSAEVEIEFKKVKLSAES